MSSATRKQYVTFWIAFSTALLLAMGLLAALSEASSAAEPGMEALIAEAGEADGIVSEAGTEIVRDSLTADGVDWTLVSYESNLGSCLASFAKTADTANQLGMVGSCGIDAAGGFESTWTVGSLTLDSGTVGVAFGFVDPNVDSVAVVLNDGTKRNASISNEAWIAVVGPAENAEIEVSGIVGTNNTGARVAEIEVESKNSPAVVEYHDH